MDLKYHVKNLPKLVRSINCLRKEFSQLEYITDIQNLELDASNNLILSFIDETDTIQNLSVDLSSLNQVQNFKPTIVVDNYNELVTVTGQELYEFAEVINSQGTQWLPGSLGGSYYPSGLYYWNGTDWINDDDKIYEAFQDFTNSINLLQTNLAQEITDRTNGDNALQALITINVNDILDLQNNKADINHTHVKADITDFNEADYATSNEINNLVDKSFLGWVQFSDTQYTETSPLFIPANTRTLLPNNAGNILNIVEPFGGNSWITNNKFTPDNLGDSYDLRVQFIIDPTLNNRNLTLELDIGGSQGVIWSRTIRLARGAGVDTKITENIDIYTLQTFVDNGGELYITIDGDSTIYNILYKIERKFRYQPSGLILPSGALVLLTPDSAYNSGGTIAQEGEEVAEWRNLITNNSAVAATQSDSAARPILQVTNGEREIRFNGGDDRLSFGIVPELDFPQPSTDYTIIAVCGNGDNGTFWFSNLFGSSGGIGRQVGMDFFNGRLFYHVGANFKSFVQAQPSIPSMVTVQRDNTNNRSIAYYNLFKGLDDVQAVNVGNATLPFLLGATNNNTSNTMRGTLKYFIVWKRVLSEQEITDVYNQILVG